MASLLKCPTCDIEVPLEQLAYRGKDGVFRTRCNWCGTLFTCPALNDKPERSSGASE